MKLTDEEKEIITKRFEDWPDVYFKDKEAFTPEVYEIISEFNIKYLKDMTEEEIMMCGDPSYILEGFKDTNLKEKLIYWFFPMFIGFTPYWGADLGEVEHIEK